MQVSPLPSGTVEYSPQQYQQFDLLRSTIQKVYDSFGYNRLETSTLQYLDILVSEGDITKEIYAITRAKSEGETTENNRGLRFDLTKPLARYITEHQGQLTFPFRRSEIGLVFRGERPQKGRLRQLYQADFDIIAREKLLPDYDAEILQIAWSVFHTLSIGPFVIRLNNRRLMQAILNNYGITSEHFSIVLSIIDKIDKIGVQAVIRLLQELSIHEDSISKIIHLISGKHPLDSLEQWWSQLPIDNNVQSAIDECTHIFNLLPQATRSNFVFDFSITRGLDYYTGIVFETHVIGYEQYGSVCSGGRYDNLVGTMSKFHFPGIGGSVGLSRLFALINNEGLTLKEDTSQEIIYFAIADESRTVATHERALTLREIGKHVVVSSGGKLSKQFEYADKIKAKWVYILEDNGSITAKNMHTGQISTL